MARVGYQLLGAIAALASVIPGISARADGYAGRYEYVYSGRQDRNRYEVRYTLDLSVNGKAELVSQASGAVPRPDADHRSRLPRIYDYLERGNRASHIGEWREKPGEVVVTLRQLGRDVVESEYHASLRGDTLRFSRLDRSVYGDARFEFRRTRAYAGGGFGTVNQDDPWSQFRGAFETVKRIGRRSDIVFTVLIEPLNHVEIVTELLAGPVPTESSAGAIADYLSRSSRVVYAGVYETRGKDIVLRMQTLAGENREDTFRGYLSGKELVLRDYDRRLYGDLPTRLIKRSSSTIFRARPH